VTTPTVPDVPDTGNGTPTPTTPTNDPELKAALAAVQTALTERAAALKSGDLSAYATADTKLVNALNALFALEQ